MGKATIIEAQNSNTVYEEGKSKGILGKLKGIFADYKHGTRNADRLYTEELWDNRVFGSEDVMEALETKTLFGELDHPEGDRCETLAKNAAITITKLEKRPEEGVIYGEAEILDTPTGRIVKALADSGARLGISSRGMGEEIYEDGQNIIDPNTYDFITFDVVVTPANEKARVALTESKHKNKITENLKNAVNDSETENQLNQLKSVAENINDNESLNLINNKLDSIKPKTIQTLNLTEANKRIALDLIKQKYEETKDQLKESNKLNESLVEENSKLLNENKYYKESKNLLKTKLKESKCAENLEVKLYKNKLEESNKTIKDLQEKHNQDILKMEETMNKLKEVHNRKIEKIEKDYTEQITKLTESNKLNESKFSKLLQVNKEITKSLEDSSKIILENEQLKRKIETLEKEKIENNKKLTENKNRELNKIKELEKQIKELKESKILMEEAEDRFSQLAFNPIGTVKALTENLNNEVYSDEEVNLFNALTNQ